LLVLTVRNLEEEEPAKKAKVSDVGGKSVMFWNTSEGVVSQPR
jgi:hypothetical protein